MIEPALPSIWATHCRQAGLTLTAPRRAILLALLHAAAPVDAVELYQQARAHHPATSLGTVYRFLRELERRQLGQPLATAHGRLHWRLREPLAKPAEADAEALGMLRQLADRLGFRLEPQRIS